ncbi:hypothetical protein ACIPSA_30690 [Streptomyces sp. NPDC086549]|uniref:hypothetical protein n=1 Tax=Streptomyces sp. NPDC086549 TaxID=3365752 RepID=UPI00380FFFCD
MAVTQRTVRPPLTTSVSPVRQVPWLVKAGPWGAYGEKFEESLRSRQLPDTRAALRVHAGLPDDGHDHTVADIWG